ncbi:MAG: flavodoxin family protein [Actinomycetota bacterium]
MFVLGINGSPRIGGNTDILLDKVLEGAKSKGLKTEKISLNKLKFSPCQECENTRDDGVCIIEDDMQIIYKKVKEADAIILASPIFFGSLSAQMKMMIDRFQCIWKAKYIYKKDIFEKGRNGTFISVAASRRRDFFNNAKSIVRNFFKVISVDYKEELFCQGVDEKGEILKHPEFLKKAFELGERIAFNVKK